MTGTWRRHAQELWPQLLALGVFAVALWAQHRGLVGVFYDDGVYVVLAKALAEGQGYANIHLPGAPPAVHFPPFYPLVLSVLWRLWPSFPDNVALLQLFDSAALAGAAWIIAAHARRHGAAGAAAYVALPMGLLAFPLLTIVGMRFSEPLFLLLVAGAVSLADRREATLATALAAGVLAGLATLTRSVGVAAIAGVAVGVFLHGGRRNAVAAVVVSTAVVVPWILWAAAHRAGIDERVVANYGTYLQDLRQTGLRGLIAGLNVGVLSPVTRLALPPVPDWVRWPLAAGLLSAMLGGGVLVARRVPALLATLGVYLVIVAVWPFAPDRFVWIILPWLALLLAASLVWGWRRDARLRAAVVVLLVALTTGYLRVQAISLGARRFAATALGISAPFALLTRSVAAELPRDAVVASADETLLYLYTGRQTVPSYLFRWDGRVRRPLPADEVVGYLCDTGATHLALTGEGEDAASVIEAIRARGDSTLSPMYEFHGRAMYRFRCPR